MTWYMKYLVSIAVCLISVTSIAAIASELGYISENIFDVLLMIAPVISSPIIIIAPIRVFYSLDYLERKNVVRIYYMNIMKKRIRLNWRYKYISFIKFIYSVDALENKSAENLRSDCRSCFSFIIYYFVITVLTCMILFMLEKYL